MLSVSTQLQQLPPKDNGRRKTARSSVATAGALFYTAVRAVEMLRCEARLFDVPNVRLSY